MRNRIHFFNLILLFAVFAFLFPAHVSARGLISTGMEIEIGRWVKASMFEEYDEWEDPDDIALVNEIGEILAGHATDRPGIKYEFYLLDTDEINAFAAPGGFIFVTRGLLDFVNRKPSLIAGVIAHEIGHVERKHHRGSMEQSIWGTIGLQVLLHAFDLQDSKWVETAGEIALVLFQQGYSREDEYDADRMGVLLTYRAGWDPERCLILFLEKLDEEYGSGNPLGDLGKILASHPPTDRRVHFAREYLSELREKEEFVEKPYPRVERSRRGSGRDRSATARTDNSRNRVVIWERDK
ncbi:MAG TPA: hypothetical protein ENN67_07110 [Firmicutes bacterium]|nr:hypothetical protein [Bacillota bacterium]